MANFFWYAFHGINIRTIPNIVSTEICIWLHLRRSFFQHDTVLIVPIHQLPRALFNGPNKSLAIEKQRDGSEKSRRWTRNSHIIALLVALHFSWTPHERKLKIGKSGTEQNVQYAHKNISSDCIRIVSKKIERIQTNGGEIITWSNSMVDGCPNWLPEQGFDAVQFEWKS